MAVALGAASQPMPLSITDSTGRVLHTFVAESVTLLTPTCYAVWNLGKVRPWAHGHQWPFSYDTVAPSGSVFFKVRLNKLHGICDVNGQPLLPAVYEEVVQLAPDVYLAKSGTTLRLKSLQHDQFLHGVTGYQIDESGLTVQAGKVISRYTKALKPLWVRRQSEGSQMLNPNTFRLSAQKQLLMLCGHIIDSSADFHVLHQFSQTLIYKKENALWLAQLYPQNKARRTSLSRMDTSRGMVFATGKAGKWVGIGKQIHALTPAYIFKGFKDNYVLAKHLDTLLGFSAEGRFVLKTTPPDEVRVQDEYHIFKSQGRFGFIDKAGHIRIAARYDSVLPFIGNYAPVRLGTRWGIIDSKEMFAMQPQKEGFEPLNQAGWLCRSEGKQQFLNATDLKPMPFLPADSVYYTKQGIAIKQLGKWGWMGRDGEIRHFPQFDALIPCTQAKALALKGKMVCLLEWREGKILKKYYKQAIFDFGTKCFVLSPELKPFAEN